jgi:AcrR family transcriptional regulator
VHNEAVAERWTQERRRQHTRDLLLDAAADVFATRGFEGASLEEIADTAGYTRGAIYKHFGGKEELFLAVTKRSNERFLQAFLDVIDPAIPLESLDLASIAKRWHDMLSRDPRQYALGAEFNLYVVRNPDVRQRVAAQRRAIAEMIASFIDDQAARIGETLRMPSLTLARIVLAASDGLELAGYLDGTDDLHEPFLQLLVSAWGNPEPDSAPPKPSNKPAQKHPTRSRKRP